MILSTANLQCLKDETLVLQAGQYASSSQHTRSTQIMKYFDFISIYPDLCPIPCDATQVALYITWLSRSFKYSSITNYISGLNYFLKLEGSPKIDYDDFEIQSAMRGAKRKLGVATKQALPILPKQLLKIFDNLNLSPGHTAFRAAVLLSFRALLRKSHITTSDSSLRREDVTFFNWGLLLTIKKSKTIQFKQEILKIPISYVSNTQLCAVHWLKKHIEECPVPGDKLLLQIPGVHGPTPLTYEIYQSTLKFCCKKAGLDETLFSSHSLRRGGCTFLAMNNFKIDYIKERGDWSSDCVYKYIKTPMCTKILQDIEVSKLLEKY